MKEHPQHQMVAHHMCQPLRPDLMQCVVYDGNSKDAHMTGVEYIIPQKAYQSLPDEEQKYWHPHNFEVYAGVLVAPNVPQDMKKLLSGKVNSYGKTFHMWNAGMYGEETTKYPMGPPRLAWSFNHLGEAKPGLVEDAFNKLGINREEKFKERKAYWDMAEPQCGVNAIVNEFKGPTEPIPPVEARDDC